MTVVLFDIDGTLITCGGAGRRSMRKAFASFIAERGLDGDDAQAMSFEFGGMTDLAIIRRGIENLAVEPDAASMELLLGRYLAALTTALDPLPDGYRVMPGVQGLLDALVDRPELAIGLGTGNVEAGASIKLSPVGLFRRFAFGGYASDDERRPELLAHGRARGAARLGRPVDVRTVIIGDTPRDVQAAHAIGAECIAVTTGHFDRPTLERESPALVVDGLDDARVFDWITRS